MALWMPDLVALSTGFTAWMLTYLVHSTLVLGLAYLLWKSLPESALAAKELILKMALVGGLLTASFQFGLGLTPWWGAWALTAPAEDSLGEAAIQWPAEEAPDSRVLFVTVPSDPGQARASASTTSRSSGSELRVRTLAIPSVAGWLSLTWLVGAAALFGGLLTSYLRLQARLSSRRRIETGPLHRLLQRLIGLAGAKATIRLSSSRRIAIPLAKGVFRKEICIPEQTVTQLSTEHQEVILAHELAHLERHDPSWLLLARTLESLLFFQPLNRLVRRLLQEVAEYRCDDKAVRQTGRPISLARVLTQLAERSLGKRSAALVPAMASDRSRLGRRIARLVDRDYPRPEEPMSRWLPVAASFALVALVLVAPRFSVASGALETPPPSSDAAAVSDTELIATPEPPQAPATPPIESRSMPMPASSPEVSPPPPPPGEVSLQASPKNSSIPEISDHSASFETLEEDLHEVIALQLRPLENQLMLQMEAIAPILELEIAAMTRELSLMEAELLEQTSLLAEAALPTQEEMETLQKQALELAQWSPSEQEIERLREQVRELADRVRPSEEELGRLREQARALAESARLDDGDLAEVRHRAQSLAEQVRPSREQIERFADQARAAVEEWRDSYLSQLEQREQNEDPEEPQP